MGSFQFEFLMTHTYSPEKKFKTNKYYKYSFLKFRCTFVTYQNNGDTIWSCCQIVMYQMGDNVHGDAMDPLFTPSETDIIPLFNVSFCDNAS